MRQRLAITLHAASVRRGSKWVLDAVSWSLRPGERWALLGENGAGKTQLLKLLSGAVWPTPRGAQRAAATRTYCIGAAAAELSEVRPLLAYVGGELQDKYARYGWNLRVRELVATGLHGTDLLLEPISPLQAQRVAAMLRRCRLTRYAGREFLSLSYGEKRLALLARALVQRPDWLLLDEFYNGLDRHFRQRIDAVLDSARRAGQSWVATAHRAMDVPRGTTRLLELRGGRVCTVRRLIAADRVALVERAAENAPRVAAPARPARGRAGDGTALIVLAHVDLYVDYRLVLRDLNWSLRAGEHWAIFGANGAGKSSFLKLLYGDLAPALGGSIARFGHRKGAPIAAWKQRIGWVSPELQSVYLVDVTVRELVASGRYASIGLNDPATRADWRVADRWLEFFGLTQFAQYRPRELSYGQLRRALIARAMAGRVRILLLDEPLTGLDPVQRATMKRVLGDLMRERVTLVAAVHHAEDLPPGMTHRLDLAGRRGCARSLDSAT